ncbi:MAG: hypothetical protein IKB64_09840 [Paludibacteraceae bacterium]|nr:hypothetical protein [Paludibacteraceae bacterium]
MYRCDRCKKIFDNLKWETEVIGVDSMSAFIEYPYCPYCDASHTGEEYIPIEEDDEDECE